VELRQYLALIRRWWWLFLLLAVLGAGAGFFYSQQITPVYEATTRLLISSGSETLPDVNAVTTGERVAQTYSELILQRDVLEQAASNLGLAATPEAIANAATVQNVSGTNILELTVRNPDPQLAADLANEIARVFIAETQMRETARFSTSRQAMDQDLAEAQNLLVELRTEVEQLATEADLLRANLARVQAEITAIENRIDEIPGDIAIAQASLDAIAALPSSSLDASALSERGRLEQQIRQLNDELARLESRLPEKLADQIEWETQLEQVLERQTPLEVELAQSEAQYQSLLNSYQELRLTEATGAGFMSIVQEAVPGRIARQANPYAFALQGAAIGLVLAFGAVLLIDHLDDKVRSMQEIEEVTGKSALGMIGRIKSSEPRDVLVTATRPRSPSAEAYRMLCSNIEFATAHAPIRTLVVTSSGPVEGKTTTAANLAVALAQAGKRVILVDTDLRRPTLHKLFGVSNRLGVSTALLQENLSGVASQIVETGVENLFLLPSGPLPPNPADLLQSSQMVALVEELKTLADIVVFDSPPVLAVADATLLARLCDGALLVVLSDSTRTGVLKQAYERLHQSGARLMGTVLNRVDASRNGYYKNYYYYSSTAE